MKRYLPFFIVGTVALVTLASGALLYRAKRLPALAIPENSTTSAMGGTEMVHVRGRTDAPVTLVEFGDFQCPPCANLSDPINKLALIIYYFEVFFIAESIAMRKANVTF